MTSNTSKDREGDARRIAVGGIPERPVSKSYEHYTPRPLFDVLNEQFRFTLDPCAATYGPKLCPTNYGPWDNGLSKAWTGRVFMNPPYGRQLPEWIAKAYDSAWSTAEVVVGLIPARTDTRWFHDYCMGTTIRFIKGRLTFGQPGKHKQISCAPFPSMVVIWGECAVPNQVTTMEKPEGS